MENIFDIKSLNFVFLFSYEYAFFLGVILFFSVYYFIAVKYFSFDKQKNTPLKKEVNGNNPNENEHRVLYLENHIGDFDRGLFYREVGLFLRKCMFDIFGEKQIYFMTGTELLSKYPSKFQSIFLIVYEKEFDSQSEDSTEERERILQKIKELIK